MPGIAMMGLLRDVGPAEVWMGASGSEVKIGTYFETVNFRFSERDAEVYEAAHGVTPVDCIKVGQDPVEMIVPFTRLSLADLSVASPGANWSAGVPSYFEVCNDQIGVSEYDNSLSVIVKPIVGDGTGGLAGAEQWLHIGHMYPKADYDIMYDPSGQRVFNTPFKSFPDHANKRVWWIGEG